MLFAISGASRTATALAAGYLRPSVRWPVYAAMAILANLLWYRSFRLLRPQLRIFNRV